MDTTDTVGGLANQYVTRSNALGVLTGLIVVAAQRIGGYDAWWYFDDALHFAAGVSLGSIVATRSSRWWHDLALVTAISVLWEMFEYMANINPWDGSKSKDAAASDTAFDAVLVSCGAYIGIRGAKQ